MEWLGRFCTALRRDDLVSAGDLIPFSVDASDPIAWQEARMVERGQHRWELAVGSAEGLEATWRVREYPDTRALECSGTLRNSGRVAIEGVRGARTLDLTVGLTDPWGEPFVRTVAGASTQNYFPPGDFRVCDRQLIRVPDAYLPVHVGAHESGFSSADNLPCAILAGESGDRGLALFYEWSGLWSMGIKQGNASVREEKWPWSLRVMAGIWGLGLDLLPGEELPLPNLLVVSFDGDLAAGGNALRRHIGRHVSPASSGEPVLPPVSFNHWFGFENDFTADRLKPVADVCAAVGVEYFCIDAGWFPGGFRGGIGNWTAPDPEKFPEGIAAFAGWLGERGLGMGLYVEPEFAHVESELFTSHPEWFLPGPETSPWMKAYDTFYDDRVDLEMGLDVWSDMFGPRFALLDLGQAEARQWWIDRVVEMYERWGIRWLRWDFNQSPRPHWEDGEAPGRVGFNQINHVQGLYEVQDAILAACPDLFFQQCAGGGQRIDLGTVRRGHSFWMNDQTSQGDIVRALQHGLNTVLPGIYADTNISQGHFDLDDYDYLSHGAGAFGVTGSLDRATADELERCRAAIERFKGYRHLLGGEYSRPTGNPYSRYEHAQVAWSAGSETVELEFNRGGVPRRAEIRHSR